MSRDGSDHETPSGASSVSDDAVMGVRKKKQRPSVSFAGHVLVLIGERITSSRTEDDFNIIGKNVAAKLRKMPTDMQMIPKKLIADVLF